MKIIFRADDLGISEGTNFGIYKSVKDGFVQSCGLMPNMPAAEHGYRLVKSFDIALGQHTNICLGTPISDVSLIPSLVDAQGNFYSSREIRARKADTIVIEECELEIEAQLTRFQEITGRVPDYFEGHAIFSKNYFEALHRVAKRHNLLVGSPMIYPEWSEETGISMTGFYQLDAQGLYDPKAYMTENLSDLLENDCSLLVFHPGFLDQDILSKSSYTLIRPMECDFLCSQWLKEFMAIHHLEAVNFKNYRK